MIPREGELVLAAVSGGEDSMVLLDFLVRLGRERNFLVAAAHYNHHLRPAADAEEAFVHAWAAERDIPFYRGGSDVAALCREEGLSVEAGARKARYGWLEALCRETGAVCVATAHHLSDQAETVLLNLIRGSGAEGLRGIAAQRGLLIRPLLMTSREEIADYAAFYEIPHVEDESNADLRFSRNRIRHEVMPQLRRINPRAEEALVRAAALLAEEDAWLAEETAARMPKIISLERGVAVEYAAFSAMDAVLRRRGVRLLLDRLKAGKKDVTAGQLGAAAELEQGKSLTLPGGILISAAEGLFRVEWQERPRESVVLPKEGEACWESWRFTCYVSKEKKTPEENTLVFSLDKIEGPVTVASWDKGGRLAVGSGSRSLKRLFMDGGVSVRERSRRPVLFCGGRPIAIVGVAADQSLAEGNGPWWVVTAAEEKE